MAQATLPELLDLKKPNLSQENFGEIKKAIEMLNPEYGNIYSSQGFSGQYYSFKNYSQLKNFLETLGFPKNTPDKYYGIVIANWYENSTKTPEYSKESVADATRPEGLSQTTVSERTNEGIFTEADKRSADIAKTRENAKTDVKNAQDRLKEIYDQQKIIQEQIKKAEELQPKFVGKKVYATVEQQELVANLEAQKSFETLTQAAIYSEYDLTDQLTTAIQEKAGLPESEELVAKTLAVQLVSDIAHSEETKKENENIAIEEAISQNKDKVLEKVLQQENALIEVAKKGFVVEAEKIKESVYLTRELAENLFGEEVANEIYGPKQIKVTISSEKSENTTHVVDLENSNRASIKTYKERYDFFEKVRKGGIDETKNIFRSQLSSNVNTYLSKKAISSPNSLLGKMGSSDAVKAILTKGSPNALELKYFGNNKLLANYFKYSPESMPYFKLFTEVTGVSVGVGVATKIIPLTYGGGGIPLAKIAYIQQVKSLGVPYTLGTKVGSKFAVGLGARTAGQQAVGQVAGQTAVKTGVLAGFGSLLAKGAAAVGVSLGVFTAGVSTAVTLAVTAVGKMINWPKIKQWFIDNKEMFVVAGAGVGLMFGGPVAGLVTGGLLMAATGTLGAFAAGTFGVLGFIGRSVGIAIATPVIITLLVIPPLVAFIMLVINNSAYVVPPSLNESSVGRITSPYIDITKTASPTGPLKNSDLPAEITYTVSIKAKKNALTNIKISDSCQVISKTATDCPDFVIPAAPESISPTSPFTFNYTGNFSDGFDDSAIINTITVTADTVDQSGATAEISNSLTIGNPPISCPVPGAKPDNSMNYSYNSSNDTGHGSKRYWNLMGSSYSYALPQSTSCMKPGDCPYYGYAYDVFPNGTTEVFAPSVLGKDVNWDCSYAFSNGGGSAGHTFHCTSTGGNYLLVLTHMSKNAKTGSVKSGDKIGSLYNQGGNTHLHLEFQLGGQWQKPEDYFCK